MESDHGDKRTWLRGRGSVSNPASRFDRLSFEPDPDALPGAVATEYFEDSSRSIISTNDSPDIALERSINPYRGCSHGCSYCFARPFHEYLGLSAGLDFETKIFVKRDAAALLREELMKPRYVPGPLAMSGATDPYQPIEKKLRITRGCLEVLAEFRNPVCIITKSALVERDVDLLAELARHRAALVILSLTTLDAELQRAMEPQASTPRARLAAIKALSEAGIPVGVNLSPAIPGLTDHEIPALLQAAWDAGARRASYVLLRLPHGVKDIFAAWLEHHYPLKKDKVLNLLRSMHGGKLYNAEFGKRLQGEGPRAEQIGHLFELHRRRLGFERGPATLDTSSFQRPQEGQLELF